MTTQTFHSPQLVEDVAKFLHNCNDNKWAEGSDKPCPGGTVWSIKCSDEYKQEMRARAHKLIALVRSECAPTQLEIENARLQGQIEALREHVPAPYEVRCPQCNALVATEYGENATMARRDGVTFLCRSCSEKRRDAALPPCAVGPCHRIDCNLCVERCSDTMHAPNCEHLT
jgi:hypothetical protein